MAQTTFEQSETFVAIESVKLVPALKLLQPMNVFLQDGGFFDKDIDELKCSYAQKLDKMIENQKSIYHDVLEMNNCLIRISWKAKEQKDRQIRRQAVAGLIRNFQKLEIELRKTRRFVESQNQRATKLDSELDCIFEKLHARINKKMLQ